MALNSMGLGVTFTARDAMSGVLGRLQRAFSGLEVTSKAAVAGIGAGFGAMAAGIGITVAGLAGLEGALDIAQAAGRFQAQIMKIGQVADVKTPEGLNQLSDAVLDASQRSGFGTQEVGQGLEDIAAMGFTATQSMQMLTPALGLAAAGTISVADAAGAMGSAMKVFGLATDEATMNQTASRLLGIANTTALQAHDLRIALGTVGRGAAAAKQSLDEMLISMGLVKNTGVDATVAASSVSSALLFMAEKADKFEKIGVSVTDADGHFRDFLDVVLDVRSALADTGNDAKAVAQVKDLFQRFGITAYQGIATQLESGIFDELTGKTYYLADAVEHLRKKQQEFADQNIVMQYANKMFNNFDGTMKRLKATWDTLIIAVGSGFADAILPVARFILNFLIGVEHAIRLLPPGAKKAAAMVFLLAASMGVAAGMATILAGAITAVGSALILASPEVLAFVGGMALATIPLAVFSAYLTAIAAGFALFTAAALSGNRGGVWEGIVATFEKWKTVLTSIFTFLSKGELTGTLADDFMKLDSDTQNTVADIVLFLKKVEVWVTAFWERFKEIAVVEGPKIFDALFNGFMRIGEALGLVDKGAWDASKALGGSEFAVKGKIAAETLARGLQKVADVLTTILNLTGWVIEKMSFWWSMFKWTPMGLALQAQMGVAKWAFGPGDDPREHDKEVLEKAERIKSYEKLPYQQRMSAEALEGMAGLPSVSAVERRRDEDIGFVKTLLADNPGLTGNITVKVMLDGEQVGEAMASRNKAKGAGEFKHDGAGGD